MAKKIVSVALVIITLFSTFAIAASAANYQTGTYVVAGNSGSNVRKGPGTGYARVGAASKGVSFKVSQISGNWGYTSSIKCTNGTRSGWVSLDYCTFKGHTHNYSGDRYYQTAHPHRISVRCTDYNTCGGWKWTDEYKTVSNCSSCKSVKYYTVTYNANGGYNAPAAQKVKANTAFNLSSSKPSRSGYSFLGWSKNKNATSASYAPGANVKTNSNVTLYAVWKKNPSAAIKLNVPYYSQTDSRWKNVKIGTKTIGQVGCTTTSIAMMYSYNTGKTVYPHEVMKKLRYANNSLYWNSLSNVGMTSKAYNSRMTNSIMSTIYAKLKEGRPVMIGATTASGDSQHWVVITGYTGTSTTSFSTANFTINDPGVQSCKTLQAFLANGSKTDRTVILRIAY